MTVVMKGFNSLLMVNLLPSMGQKSNYARCLTHHHLAIKFRANEANGAQCANVSTTTSNFLREICLQFHVKSEWQEKSQIFPL